MFDFTPVGIVVAVIGMAFVTLVGWRLVPPRERVGAEGFETGTYLTEARIQDDSKVIGKSLREVDSLLEDSDAQIVGLIRNQFRVDAPQPSRILRAGDILVIEAEPESLASALSTLGTKLEESMPSDEEEDDQEQQAGGGKGAAVAEGTARGGGAAEEDETGEDEGDDEEDEEDESPTGRNRTVESADTTLLELAVLPDSALIGRSATGIRLRTRYGINLLAFSRQGRRSLKRLRTTAIEPGDVLLMQGAVESISGFAADYGCVPLAQRSIRIPDKKQAWLAALIMAAAIVGAAFGLLPAAITFAGGVLAAMFFNVIPPRTVYDAIDWPVIVLLGAMLPVATAMASTGAADLIARSLLETVAQGNPVIALAIVLVVTMTLSDFMNNAATAAVMCPIAISAAAQLGVSADSYLMAVAIGASCAFLTPIGHQNNTLILGPGGLQFGDYWRLGLPLEIVVVSVSIPMLLIVWPL